MKKPAKKLMRIQPTSSLHNPSQNGDLMALPELVDLVTNHRVGLERLGTGVLEKLVVHLLKVETDIINQIKLSIGDTEPSVEGLKTTRLKTLLTKIRLYSLEANVALTGQLQAELLKVATHETAWTAEAYKRALTANVTMDTLTAQQLKTLVTSSPMHGKYLKDWSEGMGAATVQRIEQQILIGYTEGESVPQIIRRLRGTKAGKYMDGVFTTNRRTAEMVTRTAINHVSNEAHMQTLKTNQHLFPRYQWISALDGLTSPICRARSGKVYEMGKGPVPPAHPNCRSTIIGLPRGSQQADEETYASWLKNQTTATQKDVLGATRYKLWIDGDLKVEKFVNRSGGQITLDRLKLLETEAFTRAGL